MLRTDIYGLPPGLTGAAETYEAAFRWGQYGVGIISGVIIDQNCIDPGNTPTYELRVGLLLGKKIATGTWTNYLATNTDGSEVAAGILMSAVRTQDFQGNLQQRFYGICVGGPVQAAKILGLDYQARQQMRGFFMFDDDFTGNIIYPWKREITKTANYTAALSDNGTLFDNNGAGGTVTITLPPIQNGLVFGIKALTAQNFAIRTNEGGNLVGPNQTNFTTATLQTGSHIIGSGVKLYTNPAGTLWLADYTGPDTAGTVTYT